MKKNPPSTKGFALFECLIALFILSILCLLFTSTIKYVETSNQQLLNKKEKEWQVFLIQLENELKDCTYIELFPSKVKFKNNTTEHTVWIEYKSKNIVKIDNGGYQPLLTGLSSATFTSKLPQIEIEGKFSNKKKYQGRILVKEEEK